MLGDVIGAPVEGESSRYIAKTFSRLDDILALDTVPEILGGEWLVGRFTDDTQMTLCVARWLVEESNLNGHSLLKRFSDAYRPARRYGSGVRWILETFPDREQEWRSLATIMFPDGSYGNGSAMRAAPIGLAYSRDLGTVIKISKIASKTTHSHPLAIQGATLQAVAVALASRSRTLEPTTFLDDLTSVLRKLPWNTKPFERALGMMREGLDRDKSAQEMALKLGTGITALESVPTAIYCFLRNMDSYEECLTQAVFAGGDTDTIGCMAGSLSGAYLGLEALPKHWLAKVREETETPGRVKALAEALYRSTTDPTRGPHR